MSSRWTWRDVQPLFVYKKWKKPDQSSKPAYISLDREVPKWKFIMRTFCLWNLLVRGWQPILPPKRSGDSWWINSCWSPLEEFVRIQVQLHKGISVSSSMGMLLALSFPSRAWHSTGGTAERVLLKMGGWEWNEAKPGTKESQCCIWEMLIGNGNEKEKDLHKQKWARRDRKEGKGMEKEWGRGDVTVWLSVTPRPVQLGGGQQKIEGEEQWNWPKNKEV